MRQTLAYLDEANDEATEFHETRQDSKYGISTESIPTSGEILVRESTKELIDGVFIEEEPLKGEFQYI